MKNSILISSSILFLLFGSSIFSIAQETIETELSYSYERVTYECQVPIVEALPLPNGTKEPFATAEKSLVKGLRLIKIEALSGEVSNELIEVIHNHLSSFSGKLDYRYSLPFTKIDIKIAFSKSGKVERVMVYGDKLDEHLIKALEDAFLKWQFADNELAENLVIRFELLLHTMV